jgi:hypothetical protein
MSAKYPSSAAGDADLSIAANNLSTSLTDNPLTSGATTVNVVSTTGFPTAGYITIETEIIFYTGKTGSSFTTCTRGVDGTSAASHVLGSIVSLDIIAAHHNSLKDEIEAIETDLVGVEASITPVAAGNTATSILNRIAQIVNQIKTGFSLTNWYDSITARATTSLNNLASVAINTALLNINGTAGSPSYSFTNDPNTGIYSIGADNLGLAVAGVLIVDISGTRVSVGNALYEADGTASVPSYTFASDTNIGMYRVGADNLGFCVSGVLIVDINGSRVNVGNALYEVDGTANIPSYTFALDPNTGMYRVGTDILGFVTAGTLGIQIDAVQRVTQPAQPCFSVYLNATLSNCTGDGTVVTIPFANEVYDIGSNYNTGTYQFVAPITGKYQLNAFVCTGDGSTLNVFDFRIVTSNRSYEMYRQGAGPWDTLSLSVLADMDVNDIAYVTLTVSSGTKVIDILGNPNPIITGFSGTLVN